MTSLFEPSQLHGANFDIPVDLITRGGRGVAPLEFFVLDHVDSERAATDRDEPAPESLAKERANQTQVMIDAARADAIAEAERGFDTELHARLREERVSVERACGEFAQDRQRYFAAAEAQVVKLALAIAARVLHRETHLDPLLLEGAVRVALERMAERAGVVLRTATVDVEAWERVFHGMVADDRPKVRGDAALARGECVLETKMGTVELGVKAQLEEIEKGFFDLLSHRPERASR